MLFMCIWYYCWADLDIFSKDDIKVCVAAIMNATWPSCADAARQDSILWGICQATNCEDQKAIMSKAGIAMDLTTNQVGVHN